MLTWCTLQAEKQKDEVKIKAESDVKIANDEAKAAKAKVAQEGFLVGGVDTSAITGRAVPVTNGKQDATGIYTARGPGAPVQYAARGAGAAGCRAAGNCVILAKALLGVHVPGGARGGADSWSPPGHSGDWVIFGRKELLLPCYIVHCE
eukprot:COSAG04_NODE_5576_length_1563_cov_0.854508_3_plen_149_part_00